MASDTESSANARNTKDVGSIPGWGRSTGVGNGNLIQCSCLENSMDRGAQWVTVHGTTELDTTEQLKVPCLLCEAIMVHSIIFNFANANSLLIDYLKCYQLLETDSQ